jgi:hypothetical protein
MGVALAATIGGGRCRLLIDKAHLPLADPARDNLVETDKRPTADEQNVRGVHRGELLMRVLPAALRRHVGDGAFEDLQQRLLHALAGDIARDGRVLVLAADLVDLIDVDDARLTALHIPIGVL